MRLFPMRLLTPIVGAGMVLLFTGCGAKVHGSYRGSVKNESYGVTADLFIIAHESSGLISGNMAIGAPLSGGGSFSCVRDGKNIQFTTSDGAGGRIVWSGQIDGRTIGGRYVVEPGMLSTLVVGAGKEEGIWAAER